MANLITRFGKKKFIALVVIVVVIIIIVVVASKNSAGKYQFVTVTQGSITQIVSVTGNTTPVESLDLAFQSGGTVAAVYKNAGDNVGAGDLLERLDTSNLQAQLAQAQASVDAANAKLQSLQAGPTPQNVQVSQTALASAQQSLANIYGGVADSVTAAFAKANDAVRNQITPFYINAESQSPQLTFSVSNSQILNNVESDRVAASTELNLWQTELATLNASSSPAALSQSLTNANNHLAVVENLLTDLSTAVINNTNLTATVAATYKNDISNAVTEVEDAANGVTGPQQSIASDIASIAQAQAALNLTLAGSTSQDIAAQQAAVEQAQANVKQIQVEIGQASLSSPIAGVVTVQNAKVGEIAAAGQTMTSIISANNLEVDADVPETDIGKVAVGNPVSMTFDAFPGETFTGKVFYIDPAETIVGGVVDYLVKVSFDTADARIKSGLTANLNIETKTDPDALILPQYAITQNASGTFVDILQNGADTQIPVTVGIQDQSGNAEITNGVTAGEQVINIGLKAQ